MIFCLEVEGYIYITDKERYLTCFKCRNRHKTERVDIPLKVYLIDDEEVGRFILRYSINAIKKRYDIKYKMCGREEGLKKAYAKVVEIKKAFRVNLINKVKELCLKEM